jgi:outer membrane protein TolC
MFKKIRYLLVSVCCLIGGCALMGPDYEKPDAHVPEEWSNTVVSTNYDTKNMPELAWWEEYNDPTLNQLIDKALKVNNNVQIAVSNLEVAQGELEQTELGWVPSFNLLAGLSQLPNLGYPGTFLAFIPEYILNIFTQIKKVEFAEYGVERAEYAKDAVRLSTIGMIANSYFTYLAQRELYAEFVELDSTLMQLSSLITQEFEIGTKNLIDIQVIDAEVDAIQAQLKVFEHNIVISSNSLKYLINENPGSILTDKSFTELPVSTVNYANMPATVLADRPDIGYAETQLKMANTAIGIATSSFLPGINLKAFISRLSNTEPAPQSGLQTPDENVFLKQAMLTYDFDPTMIGKISTASSEYRSSYYSYFNQVRLALKEVDTALSANQLYTQSYENLYSSYQHIETQYDLTNQLYEIGLDSLIQALYVKVKLQELKIELTQNKLQQLLTVVALYQNLGGGYLHDTKDNNESKDKKE